MTPLAATEAERLKVALDDFMPVPHDANLTFKAVTYAARSAFSAGYLAARASQQSAAQATAEPVDNRRCKPCAATRGGDNCWKCGAATFTPHPLAGEDPKLPPIDRIRALAKEVGYAIGVHGSQQRDFDVIAAPWTDSAIGNHALLQHIAAGLTTENGPAHIISTERKPLGRYAATIQMDGWYKQLDISIFPVAAPDRAPSTDSAADARDAARYRFMMSFQDGGEQPEEILMMWRKVIAEHRLTPTRADYESAIDAAIAASMPQKEKDNG